MLEQLEAIKARFDQVGVALTNPEIINNQKEFGRLSKEYRDLEKIVNPYTEYKRVLDDYDFSKEALNGDDEDMQAGPLGSPGGSEGVVVCVKGGKVASGTRLGGVGHPVGQCGWWAGPEQAVKAASTRTLSQNFGSTVGFT